MSTNLIKLHFSLLVLSIQINEYNTKGQISLSQINTNINYMRLLFCMENIEIGKVCEVSNNSIRFYCILLL